jgi:hypothetical protein
MTTSAVSTKARIETMANPKPRWDAAQHRDIKVLPTEAFVTHLGRRKADGTVEFREEPAWRIYGTERWVEVDVSMIEGRLSAAQVVRFTRRRPQTPRERRQDCVRYFESDRLIQANYYPCRTPTAGIPAHVSVYGNLREMAQKFGTVEAEVLIHQDAHRWWWAKPGRVRLETIEAGRRF